VRHSGKKLQKKEIMNSKVLCLFLSILLFSCNKKQEKIYTEILYNELNESKSFIQNQIIQQESYIESKVSDFPYLKSSNDSLKKLKLEIENFEHKNRIYQKDSLTILKFKKKIELKSNQTFELESVKIKSEIENRIFNKLFELDMTKMKYKLNESYIATKCNIVS
jgi:hypothetical protein